MLYYIKLYYVIFHSIPLYYIVQRPTDDIINISASLSSWSGRTGLPWSVIPSIVFLCG